MPPKTVPSIKSVTKKDTLTLVCEWKQCQEVYKQFEDFVAHITNHITELYHTHSNSDTPDAPYLCEWRECGHDSFPGFPEIMRHINFHAFHVKIKSQGMILLLKNNLRGCLLDAASRNMIPELPDRLICGWIHCQGVFDNPVEFYSHVKNHCDCFPDGNKPPGGCKCAWEGCLFVGKSKHKLKDHMRSHTQEKFVACPTCGGLYSNSTKFFDHIKRQSQSDVHSYQCSHCNKRFSSERLLRDHMRHHVNHYKCPYCDMTVPNPSGLRTHIRYRHQEERPFACTQCEYRAKTQIDLRRHIDSHKPEGMECEFENCKFKCKTYWDMNAHYKLKHEDGPIGQGGSKYMCHICGNLYWCGNKLTEHLRRKHKFKWPSGHTRFRYKVHEDGYYRLQTVRYESIELTEQMLHNRMEENGDHHEGGGGDPGMQGVPDDPSHRSPSKSIRVGSQTSPNKATRSKSQMMAKLKKRLDGVPEGIESETVQVGEVSSVLPATEMGAIQSAQIVDEPASEQNQAEQEPDAEAYYSYNLEMLGDVALQNSDVHSSQEFAATSTPQRPKHSEASVDEETNTVDFTVPSVIAEFEMARKALGVFTPVKDRKRKRNPSGSPDSKRSCNDDNVIISQGGNLINPMVFTKALASYSTADTTCSMSGYQSDGLDGTLSVADPSHNAILTSGSHQIHVTSDVPVEFSGVVKVVEDSSAVFNTSSNSDYVIQEIGGPRPDQFLQQDLISTAQGVSRVTDEQKDCESIAGSARGIEDDIFTTAQELGISISN